jgi:glycosyltransferase involved in cell wall biosynthesis
MLFLFSMAYGLMPHTSCLWPHFMPLSSPLKVHVLVDLEWSEKAGGHVKCWERFASAAVDEVELDLTVHFAGPAEVRPLGKRVRFVFHPPVFSTRRLFFLGHVPDHSDLASFHPGLYKSLEGADVVHTTDAFFAYARTAETWTQAHKRSLTHSIHTDTVAYTEIFTRRLLEKRLGFFGLAGLLDKVFKLPQKAARDMKMKLSAHEKRCRFVLTSREEDKRAAIDMVGEARVRPYRLGLDFGLFNPARANRTRVEAAYRIPKDSFVLVFVGRLDEGKNIYVLLDAVEQLIAKGVPLFLIAAGVGPAKAEIERRLNFRCACPGFVSPENLAEIYASADRLALPSAVETWSMAAAEALACGLPVLAAETSGVARFLSATSNVLAGDVVREDSVAAWVAAIEGAYATRHDATKRTHALACAKAHFPTWREALQQDFIPVWRAASGKT